MSPALTGRFFFFFFMENYTLYYKIQPTHHVVQQIAFLPLFNYLYLWP